MQFGGLFASKKTKAWWLFFNLNDVVLFFIPQKGAEKLRKTPTVLPMLPFIKPCTPRKMMNGWKMRIH